MKGTYTIIATFVGSDSYYGSQETAYVTVDPAPAPYPTVTIPPYPGYQGPSAQDVANRVLDNLPDSPTADNIANEVLAQLPETPVTPEYTTIDLVIILAVVAVAVLVVYTLITIKKQK